VANFSQQKKNSTATIIRLWFPGSGTGRQC